MSERLRVGIYVNDPEATTLRLVRCVQGWGMAYETVWREELETLPERDIDVLLLHGGWYGIDRVPGQNQDDVERQPHHARRGDAVRAFVEQGGGVVGVCAGAFNVVWLGLIEADISRATGIGMHAMEVVRPEHPIADGVLEATPERTDRRFKPVPVVRVSGPIFFPKQAQTMIFSYDWERRLGAVLASDYGQGRAVAISPHPERTEDDLGKDIPLAPLMPVARLLRNALLWTAHQPTDEESHESR